MKTLNSYFLDFLKVTEQSALACYPFIGKGDAQAADQAAVDAMRLYFQKLKMDVQIVIGEGERDKAPRLYTGEQFGDQKSDLKIDVAVDPLEGTTICAEGRSGSLSVMAISLRGGLFKAPDVYMKKVACGPKAKGSINLNHSVIDNVLSVSKALNKKPEDLVVGVLKRERHKDLIKDLRQAKVQILLVGDGDVALALQTAFKPPSLDLLIGTGGAPEGVLAAAALKCLGGDFQGQLIYKDEEEEERAKSCGIKDLHKVWTGEELASGDVFFYSTGVTKGSILDGISKEGSSWASHSLILSDNVRREVRNYHEESD